MKLISLGLASLAIALLMASCASSRFPIGFDLEEDLSADLTGVWMNPEGHFHVHCDANGKLQVAGLEWQDDEEAFKVETASGPLKRLDDDLYVLNLREADEDQYMFALVSFEEGRATVWGPDPGEIRSLVEAGKLEGELPQYGVTITMDGGEAAKILSQEAELNGAFTWRKPMVFWKQADRE